MEAILLIQFIIMEKHSNQINTPWWNKEKGSWLTDSQSLRKPQVEPRWVQLQISIRHKPTQIKLIIFLANQSCLSKLYFELWNDKGSTKENCGGNL